MARRHIGYSGLAGVIALGGLMLGSPVAGEDGGMPAMEIAPAAHVAITPQAAEMHVQPAASGRVIRRHSDGLFYVDAQANGQSIRFVVDTGATVVVLNREDAERLGLSFETLRASGNIRTAGGGAAMRWARIERLEMAGKRMEQLHAAVVEAGLPVSLMGQNALEQLGTVTLRGDTMTIE